LGKAALGFCGPGKLALEKATLGFCGLGKLALEKAALDFSSPESWLPGFCARRLCLGWD
jgi:hypothetical protein